MAIEIKHKFVSTLPDGPDPTQVNASNWNDTHEIRMGGQRLLGRAAGTEGPADEIIAGAGLKMTSAGVLVSAMAFRNKIINGNFSVNQRGALSRYVGAGVYGYDRWKGASVSTRIMQVIENLPAGTYTLSWSGGGTGRIGSNTLGSSPRTNTHSGGNLSVEVPVNATLVQLELGTEPTEFEDRPITIEQILCKRYFQRIPCTGLSGVTYTANGDTRVNIQLPVEMRTNASLSQSGQAGVVAFGQNADSINVDLGTFTMYMAHNKMIRISNISNNSIFGHVGPVFAWGTNSENLFINCDAEL